MRGGRLWFFAVIAAVIASDSNAAEIAEGCATPKIASSRRAFYVDPASGSMNNDGSAARPWSTLSDVLDGRRKLFGSTASVIKPGDVIYLNTGNHGNVQLGGSVNSEFITVQAAAGQTPMLRSLTVNNASKWMFVGLKIQGVGDGSSGSSPGPALVQFGRNQSAGPTSEIIFSGNTVSTVDDTSPWANDDWVKKPFNFGLLSSAACVSISGNRFFNLRNAVQFDGDRHLVFGNRIDNFGADGIDVIASNATIRGNVISDGRHSKVDPLHPDGIQGWTKKDMTNTNVVIDGNVVIKTGNPDVTEMQGISIFDGKWDGLTISNNVVVTNHWHGIAVSGVTNTRIVNNTVVAYDPVKRPTWINVNVGKDGAPPRGVVVRNNITTRLVFTETGVTVDHNIVAQRIDTPMAGKPTYNSKPGYFGNRNLIDPAIYQSLVSVDNQRGTYDLRLKENSPARGFGSPDMAPKLDILGKPRIPPIDIGAYAH